MKAEIDVPAKVDVDTTIHNITIELGSKTAHLSVSGVDHPQPFDFTAYYTGLSAPNKLVIDNFLIEIIAGSFGITPGEVTGTLFVLDPPPPEVP